MYEGPFQQELLCSILLFVTQKLERENKAWSWISCSGKKLHASRKRKIIIDKQTLLLPYAVLHQSCALFVPILFFLWMFCSYIVNMLFMSLCSLMISQKRQLCLPPLLASNPVFPNAFLLWKGQKCSLLLLGCFFFKLFFDLDWDNTFFFSFSFCTTSNLYWFLSPALCMRERGHKVKNNWPMLPFSILN